LKYEKNASGWLRAGEINSKIIVIVLSIEFQYSTTYLIPILLLIVTVFKGGELINRIYSS